jgi:hypothetical protein
MPKLSWILIPLTALTWWHAYHIYLEANLPLLTTGRFDDQIAEPISESGGRSDDGTIIDDKPDRLFYFIQISDLHISAYRRQSMHHLRLFLNTTLPIIRPQFVLVTGGTLI